MWVLMMINTSLKNRSIVSRPFLPNQTPRPLQVIDNRGVLVPFMVGNLIDPDDSNPDP